MALFVSYAFNARRDLTNGRQRSLGLEVFFGQARAAAHQGEPSAREPGQPEGRWGVGGWEVHCTPLAGGESFQSVGVTSGRVSSTSNNRGIKPGQCDVVDFIYSSVFLFILVLCVFAVQFILAQHPLHQPDPGQHQSRRQQLPADLHRREHCGDDQLVHTAQRPV